MEEFGYAVLVMFVLTFLFLSLASCSEMVQQNKAIEECEKKNNVHRCHYLPPVPKEAIQ